MTYKAIKNFSNHKVSISEGEILTREELLEKFEGEGVLNYMFTCTNLKFCLEKIEDVAYAKPEAKPEAAPEAEAKPEATPKVNAEVKQAGGKRKTRKLTSSPPKKRRVSRGKA